MHIRALRDKIDRPFAVHSIETVRGIGYRLRTDGERIGRVVARQPFACVDVPASGVASDLPPSATARAMTWSASAARWAGVAV